ncbi:MAG: DUF72 domain-containing protein [Anaerolineales bacterium]|jgi:uncharacterized protein YecE (DUF72 family)|nr:DUF72 domain-containing protein [Anaerolineales bacterium]
MVAWYLGTMGFSYKDWERVFYPERLSSRNYLRHYSRYFNAVEIDSTFYGTPRLETVRQWAGITPHDFQICVKTPRRITHESMLKDSVEEMREFVRVVSELGEKLGVILIQFPPSFTCQGFFEILEEFLSHLRSSIAEAKDIRFAVEFRHLSWYTIKTAEMLGNYQVCWTATEYPKLPNKIHKTTDYLYIRWIGQHGTYLHHDREVEDKISQLERWWELIQDNITSIDSIYGFFNNDYSGHAPVTCNKFKSITGLPTKTLRPPQQGTLF